MKKFLAVFLAFAVFVPFFYPSLQYAFGFRFDKNLLISDAVFNDYQSMDLKDIQKFLNDKGSFISQFKQDGISAAEIIFDASQKYKINPKVILVTLQKEEGLISLRQYNKYALNFAMGFHKPSDFKSQVYGGTKLLRDGYDFLAAKYGWKVGEPHRTEDNPAYVNNVVIPQNRATAALYLYTPYIGGYFLKSGAYVGGNYNFVKIFNRFFGNPFAFEHISIETSNTVLYVPEGKPCSVILKLKNTGNVTFPKESLTVFGTSSGIAIRPAPIETNLPSGKEISVSVVVPPLSENTTIYFGLKEKDGKQIGNSVKVLIVPVSLKVWIRTDKDFLFVRIQSKINVPYAYIKLLSETDDGMQYEKYILSGDLLSGAILRKVSLPEGMSDINAMFSFIGSNSPCKSYEPIDFYSYKSDAPEKKFLLKINSVPPGAEVFVDEKDEGKTPLSVLLNRDKYTVTIVANGFPEAKKEVNLNYDTSLNFNIKGGKFLPPDIKLSGIPSVTNKKAISIGGEVVSDNSVISLTVNGKKCTVNNGKFSAEVQLSEGENTVTVEAYDSTGNSAEIFAKVIFDDIPPKISVNAVPPVTSNRFVKISAVSQGASSLSINGERCYFTNCTKFVKLKNGKNEIIVKAEDEAGNESIKKLNVIYLPDTPTVIRLYIGKKFILVNGKEKQIDAAPIIKEDRTMLPIRFVVESLGGSIYYRPISRTVEIFINGSEIVLAIGKNKALVNGEEKQIDENPNVVPFIMNGRTFLPLRFIMESTGSSVEWIPSERSVVIVSPAPA